MRLAVYARTSTEEQAERHTIAVQLTEVRHYCEAYEHEIVEEFIDEGVSGAIPLAERPSGARLIAACEGQKGKKERRFDALLSYSVDRLGRDALQALLAIERLKALKVPATFVRESFSDDPSGDFQRTVMLGVAQLERALITQRTSGGRYRAVREGSYMASSTPYGFRRAEPGDPNAIGGLVLHHEEAEVVRRMYRMATRDGMGLTAIIERFDAEKVPPPPTGDARRKYGWCRASVWRILGAPRNCGEGEYAGIRMPCPSIVSRSEFDEAQRALARRKTEAKRNVKAAYRLRGLLYCRHCGSRMMGESKRAADGSLLLYYVCANARSRGGYYPHEGVKWRVSEAAISPVIEQAVDDFLSAPAEALRRYDATIERDRNELAGAAGRKAALDSALAQLPERENRALDAYTRGIVGTDVLQRQLDAIKRERTTIDAQLAEARAVLSDGEADLAVTQTVRALIASGAIGTSHGTVYDEEAKQDFAIRELSPEERARRVATVIERIWVEADGALTLVGPGQVELCGLDDAVTTGSTANECARALREHGARKVYAIGFARASYSGAGDAAIMD
jgi:site-specific DNA recombinase